MSWFGGFFAGLSVAANFASGLIICSFDKENKQLKEDLDRSSRTWYKSAHEAYNRGKNESIDAIVARLANESVDGNEYKRIAEIITNMSREERDVLIFLVKQALEEGKTSAESEKSPNPTIVVDIADLVNSTSDEFTQKMETIMSAFDGDMDLTKPMNFSIEFNGDAAVQLSVVLSNLDDKDAWARIQKCVESFDMKSFATKMIQTDDMIESYNNSENEDVSRTV